MRPGIWLLATLGACGGSDDAANDTGSSVSGEDTGPATVDGVTIEISPRPAYEDSTLSCTYSVELDRPWRQIWIRNYEVLDVEADTLTGEWFDKDDWVVCAIEFEDNGERAESYRSNIKNTVPEILSAEISPSEPTANDAVISGSMEVSDIDPADVNFGEHYRWFVNGVETAYDEYVIGRAYWQKGDEVSLKVWVSDYDDTTDKVEVGSVIIGNATPGAPEVGFVEDPVGGEPLECMIIEEAEDLDGDALSYNYIWRRFGLLIDQVGSTIDPAEAGASYTCEVTADDGEAESEEASATVDVGGGVIRYLWRSEAPSGRAGLTLFDAPDVTGDGAEEILAGRPWSAEGETQGGGVALLDAAAFALEPEVGEEAVLLSIYGEQSQGYLGTDAVWINDTDGDGLEELVISEPGYLVDRGAFYLFRSARWSSPTGDLPAGSAVAAAEADLYHQSVNEGSGSGIAMLAHDSDGDGRSMLLVGSPGREDIDVITGALLIYPDDLLAGGSGEVSDTAEDGVALINGEGGAFGDAIVSVPDMDGDGIDDLAISAPDSGKIYLTYGADIGAFTEQIDNIACATLTWGGGDAVLEAVTLADGGAGLVVGLPEEGAAWLWPISSDATTCGAGELALSSAAYGIDGSEELGAAVRNLGAMEDGDLGDWVAIGAPGDDTTYESAGAVYLVPTDDWSSALDVGDWSGGALYGEDAYDEFGYSVNRVTDLNRDGWDDLAVGVPRLDGESGFDLGGLAIWLSY